MHMFVDFHCHFPTKNAIYCTAKPQPIATPELENGNQTQTPLLYCQGLLPQFWTEKEQAKLLNLLEDPYFQLGEVGIDKRFQTSIDLQKQEENLLTMLQFASEHEKIITIHSVQATERTLKALQQVSQNWKTIWHGFTGSLETAEILYKRGIFLSVGPRFLQHPQKYSLKDLAKAHPNFVLETDYEGCDQKQYNDLLENHYLNCAQQLGWNLEDLKEHCYGQAQTLTN